MKTEKHQTLKLTPKQETFCQEYIKTGNQSEAYRRAYDASRMKETTINVKASQMLKEDKISIRVKQLQAEIKKRVKIEQDDILKELMGISFYDARRLFDEHNNIKPPSELDLIDGKVISSIKVVERTLKDGEKETSTEYKLNNKLSATDQINKILGHYAPEKREHSGEINVNTLTDRLIGKK